MPTSGNARLFNLILVVVSVAGSLAVGEAVLRALGFGAHVSNTYFRFDRQLGYRGRPGDTLERRAWDGQRQVAHVLNRHGFMSPEFEPGAGTNIVLLGDSFIASDGVSPEESFRSVFETTWREKGDAHTRVHNLALSGFGTDQEIVAFQIYGKLLEPDYVLLFFYVNDIRDNIVNTHSLQPRYSIASDRIVSLRKSISVETFWNYLLASSALASTMNTAFTGGQGLRARLPERDFSYVQVERRVFSASNHPDVEQEWGRLRKRLRVYSAQALATNTRPIVVYIPSRDQVNHDEVYEPLAVPFVRHRRVQERLARLCKEIELEFVDLTPVFSWQEAQGRRLYNDTDSHWTALGIRVAARHIAGSLSE